MNEQELSMLDQLTIDNAREMYQNYESKLFKDICQKIHEYSQKGVKWNLNTIQYYFYKWGNDPVFKDKINKNYQPGA